MTKPIGPDIPGFPYTCPECEAVYETVEEARWCAADDRLSDAEEMAGYSRFDTR